MYLSSLEESEKTNLAHGREEFLPAPSLEAPVVVVLFGPSDTQRAVASTAAAQKPTPAELDLPVVDAIHRRRDDIPVRLGIEVVRPSAT